MWIQLIPHTTTPSKHHSYLSPHKKQQKQVAKIKNLRTYRDGIPKKQPNKVGMIPQYPYGLSSLYLLPYFAISFILRTLVAKMAKDIGMTIRKGIVVSFLPCLVAFWGFHSYMFFHFLKHFFATFSVMVPFGDYFMIRQTGKLKSSPNFPSIQSSVSRHQNSII